MFCDTAFGNPGCDIEIYFLLYDSTFFCLAEIHTLNNDIFLHREGTHCVLQVMNKVHLILITVAVKSLIKLIR